MTIYLEKTTSCIRVTCLDPLFLGYIKDQSFHLGDFCQGRIDQPMPQGYGVTLKSARGFFRTKQIYTQGQQKEFWVVREEISERGMVKPLRLQEHLPHIPYTLYKPWAFIASCPDHLIHCNHIDIFQHLKTKNLPNSLKLDQTSKPLPDIQQAWDKYMHPVVSWKEGHIIIEEGHTLTALDVNTQLYFQDYGEGGSAILKNDNDIERYWLKVIPVLLDIIRIRLLSGMILIDLPRFNKQQGDFLLRRFMSNLKQLELKSLGLTRGGLWELIRPRRVPSLQHQQGNNL